MEGMILGMLRTKFLQVDDGVALGYGNHFQEYAAEGEDVGELETFQTDVDVAAIDHFRGTVDISRFVGVGVV